MKTQNRNPAMDLIRCVALLCVVGVHFFMHTGFYEQTVQGVGMYIAMVLRTFLMVCVPLFLILSGYLMRTKN